MRKALLLITVYLLWFVTGSLQAQQWQYYNPTLWYDVNAVEILGPGIIVTGGGWEANDSAQIMYQTADYGVTWFENPYDGLAPWNKSVAFSNATNGFGEVAIHARRVASLDIVGQSACRHRYNRNPNS